MFTATFIYSLSALGWVDRNGEGRVPFFSTWVVIFLVIASVMALAFLVQRLAALQVSGVIAFVGGRGRQVIGEMYPVVVTAEGDKGTTENRPDSPALSLPATQIVLHSGAPMAISKYNLPALVKLAQQAGGVIVMPFAVGDTVVEGGRHLGRCMVAIKRSRQLFYAGPFSWSINAPLTKTLSTLFDSWWTLQ